MKIKLPFGHSKRVVGEASIGIKASSKEVFSFIAENFFLNYPKWTPEIVALESLEEGNSIFIGAKGRQVREDNGALVESLFEIVEYTPYSSFILQGSNIPYRNTYLTAREDDDQTRLTFRFELLDIELFMRPFEKLIRIAIEEGAENAVEKIKELVTIQCLQRAS